MADLYLNQTRPVFSSQGIESGAKAFFYFTGTTTLTPVFADAALTTELTNPVVANAAGVFPDIYLDTDNVTYRTYLTDADGALLSDVDPYYPGDLNDAVAAQVTAAATSATTATTKADEAAASAAEANAAVLVQGGSWWLAGDGQAPSLIYDATHDSGLTLDGSGDVSAILNLGSAGGGDLAPTGATNSPVSLTSGFRGVEFDGNGTYDTYEGAATYAGTVFDTDRATFSVVAVQQSVPSGDQVGLSVGKDGASSPRHNILLKSNQITTVVEYHDGTSLRTINNGASETRTSGDITLGGHWHNGTDVGIYWQNGRIIEWEAAETQMAATTLDPAIDIISVGGLANGSTYSLNGRFLLGAFDNDAALSLDQSYAKYKASFAALGKIGAPAFALWALGQSNMEGAFANSNPFNFGAEEGYSRAITGGYDAVLNRAGFGHSTGSIGDSSPAVYFADEWAQITGGVPIFQQLAFSGQPITPGLSGKAQYWAPKNDEGDAAGDTSLMEVWANDFARFRDLINYSPEFDVKQNIGFILEGEADAVGFTNGDNVTTERLVEFINSWLNKLRSDYGIATFAVVNIGRSGSTLSAVTANAAGVTVVRDAWSQVIASRSDCYDVFPHLNHLPDPFTLDDLVIDGDGSWVSGQANDPDGIHYLDKMYQAIGRTSARNLAQMLGV